MTIPSGAFKRTCSSRPSQPSNACTQHPRYSAVQLAHQGSSGADCNCRLQCGTHNILLGPSIDLRPPSQCSAASREMALNGSCLHAMSLTRKLIHMTTSQRYSHIPATERPPAPPAPPLPPMPFPIRFPPEQQMHVSATQRAQPCTIVATEHIDTVLPWSCMPARLTLKAKVVS